MADRLRLGVGLDGPGEIVLSLPDVIDANGLTLRSGDNST